MRLSDQIYGRVFDEIVSRRYAVGDRLPTEMEISEAWACRARSSARRSLGCAPTGSSSRTRGSARSSARSLRRASARSRAQVVATIHETLLGFMRLTLSLTRTASKARAQRVLDEHALILDAIREGDGELARTAMTFRLSQARRRLVDRGRDD